MNTFLRQVAFILWALITAFPACGEDHSYCKGETAALEVKGTNVRWYKDQQKSKLLHSGNVYELVVTQADTFYVTQVVQGRETDPLPIVLKVGDPTISDVKVTHANCDQDNGIISVTAEGEGPLMYSLDNGTFQSSPVFTGLYAKTFLLSVKSQRGCLVTREISVEKKWRQSFVMAVVLNPCTSGNKDFSALALGGYGPITYALDEGPFQKSGLFANLESGGYTLRARDSVGCEISMDIKIPDKSEAVKLQRVDIEHARCGAEFGGVTLIATGSGQMQYSLDGQNYLSSPIFTRVPPGAYEVFVKGEGGCVDSRKIVIGQAPAPEFLEIIETNATCKGDDGSVVIYAVGSGPLLYSIDAVNYVRDTVFTGLSPLTQTVYVRDTAGCDAAHSIYIEKDCQEKVHIPSAFSPDSDGRNEVMDMKFSDASLKIRYFRVFNRWGTVIANRTDQMVESGFALWDGSFKGDKVQPGTYPYELLVEFDNGSKRLIRDAVLLLR